MDSQKYEPPLDPSLATKFYALDKTAQEFFQERAAIRQFDGGQSRLEAEAAAWEDTMHFLQYKFLAHPHLP